MGLAMGISILTVFEFIFFAYDYFVKFKREGAYLFSGPDLIPVSSGTVSSGTIEDEAP